MKQFKTGDKVRFRQNGVFGNMNKYMYANNVMLDREYEVIDITGRVARIIGYNLYFDIPYDCLELIPEPQSKFANIKVGDWVEHLNGTHLLVTATEEPVNIKSPHIKDRTPKFRCNNRNTYSVFDGSCIHDEDRIVRILSPKKVIVDFGSGIAGTIERRADSICVFNKCGKLVAWIYLSLLDPETRAKVESIIKAQEEE